MRRVTCPTSLIGIFILLQVVWSVISLVLIWRQPSTEERTICSGHPAYENDAKASLSDRPKSKNTSGEACLLAVIVLSSAGGRERRDGIRDTWARLKADAPVIVKFVIGTSGLKSAEAATLHAEIEQGHDDLLLLTDLRDTYANLTRKVLGAFRWLDGNLKFSYVLKVDDDSFVVLESIVRELSVRESRKALYWGFFDGRATPKKKGKWTEDDWILCDRYLPYALGGGYVLSADLVHAISVNAPLLQVYGSEDVSVGVWTSAFEAERKHDVRFNTEYVSRGCHNSYLVSHKQSIDDMRSLYESITLHGIFCPREYQTRLSYQYRWDEAPSKCCERLPGIP